MVARFKQMMEDRAWRCYVADSLQMLPENKHFVEKYSTRYAPKPADDRPGDEIAADVIQKLGLKIVE